MDIKFDAEKLRKLKEAYYLAHKEGKESFVFEGQEFLTSYAKYLIEFLTNQLGK